MPHNILSPDVNFLTSRVDAFTGKTGLHLSFHNLRRDKIIMIEVHRLNGDPIVINATHIATLESTPDTLVTLLSGERLVLREKLSVVVTKTTGFFKAIGLGPYTPPRPDSSDDEDDEEE